LGAPSKIARVLKLTGLRKDLKAPKEGGIRCLPRYTIELYSPKMTKLASAGFACSSGSGKGSVWVAAKKRAYLIETDLDAVNKIVFEPQAIGDVLYGITNVTVQKFKAEHAYDTGSSDYLGDVLGSFNKNHVPKTGAIPKCVPEYMLKFFRGKDVVAHANVLCSGETTLLVPKAGSSELETLGLVKADAKSIGLVHGTLEEINDNADDWGNFTPEE
jgi:hypothetical protein